MVHTLANFVTFTSLGSKQTKDPPFVLPPPPPSPPPAYYISLNIPTPPFIKTPLYSGPNSTNICKISLLNKGVELISVPRVFHEPSVKACLPTDIKFDDPTVAYFAYESNQVQDI